MEIVRHQGQQQPQRRIQDELTGYWAQDVWIFRDCPLVGQDLDLGSKRISPDKALNFQCRLPKIKAELKYGCWRKFEQGEWSPDVIWTQAAEIHTLIEWLKVKAHPAQSLLDKSLQQWELSFRSYLVEIGKLRDRPQKKLRGRQERLYFQETTQITKLREIYKKVEAFYAQSEEGSEYEKDVWDLRKLGVFVNPARSNYSLNFKAFQIPWLKKATQLFIKYSLSIHSAGECQNRIGTLRRFSRFLIKTQPNIQPENIDRAMILEYFAYLRESELQANTRIRHISQIRTFLELCAQEGWANIPNKRLIYREDFPKHTKAQPRYIPEEVMEQLNNHLESLDTLYARIVLVLQECGMRIGELCRIAFDCLLQDAYGDWFLRYYQFKMKKEHSVPITRELAAIVQQQQAEVTKEWGENFPYLFPKPKPKGKGGPIKQENFTRILNRLAIDKQIVDSTGHRWHFQAHQFRHTVGTRMVNNKVPHHIIQRFLGHESPEMTARYATIHDETLKKEFEKFMGSKVVNVQGKSIGVGNQVRDVDLQWFKKHILAQSLPNGTCALPTLMGPCPHANACLTCTHFRTDARFLPEHEKQLEQTEKLLQTARGNGWQRQVEMNERVHENLTKIVSSLKEQGDESAT